MGNILSDGTVNPDEPNLEMIRRAGWAVRFANNLYCVAWRGRSEEVVLIWRGGIWEQLTGHGQWRDGE